MRRFLMVAVLTFGAASIDDVAFAGSKGRGVAKGRAAPAARSDDGYFSNYITGPGGTKIPVRDYPGSATVITRKMMDDFQARNICDALRMAPGVSVSGCW